MIKHSLIASTILFFIVFCSTCVSAQATAEVVKPLISKFSFEAGKGTFTQSKSFKFMATPIVSYGKFIVDGDRVSWQTTSPINSEILLTNKAVYKRLPVGKGFELVAKESPINRMLSAILTGKFDEEDWIVAPPVTSNKSTSCLLMSPKSSQLMAVFISATLCLKNEKKREVTLLDKQNNRTFIVMSISDELLTSEDKQSLEYP